MLNQEIRDATGVAHQQLEKTVIYRIKAISSEQDYAGFLKYFYAYFRAVEETVKPFITTEVLADYPTRRSSSYLKNDIGALGGDVDVVPGAIAPAISNAAEAMGALYVLEGSIMGGPYIVQMLQKRGIGQGFTFFSGYGAQAGQMWQTFIDALNAVVATEEEKRQALEKAVETFSRFEDVFAGISVI